MMKDPAFLFYSSDFLAGTMLMTDEQVGQYIKLMCIQHQNGFVTLKDMSIICKTHVEDIDNTILSKFKKESDGNYYNERLKTEMNRRKAYSESRRNNRKGSKHKVLGQEKPKKKEKKICKTYDVHMGTETITITKTINNYSKNTILVSTINEFILMREQIKKPMSLRAVELLLGKLDKNCTNDEEKINALNESIMNSWQSVYFDIRRNGNKPQKKGVNYEYKSGGIEI